MTETVHRIRSQRWIVHASSVEEAFAWRQFLHDRAQATLLPAFEQAFDQIANGDRLVHIKKLDLSIRLSRDEDPAEMLPVLIVSQLKERLSEAVRVAQLSAPPAAETGESTGVAGMVRVDGAPFQSAGKADAGGARGAAAQARPSTERGSSEREQAFGGLIQYLDTGTVPWYLTPTLAIQTGPALAYTCVAERSRLVDHVVSTRPGVMFYFRLLDLLPDGEGKAIILAMAKKASGRLGNDSVALATALLTAGAYFARYTRLRLVATLLSLCLGGLGAGPDHRSQEAEAGPMAGLDRDAYREFASTLSEPAASVFRALVSSLAGRASAPGPGPAGLGQLSGERIAATILPRAGIPPATAKSGPSPRGDSPRGPGRGDGGAKQAETVEALPAGIPPWREVQAPQARSTGARSEASREDLFPLAVQQAGLVLLHPFLLRFFEAVGIKEKATAELPLVALPRAAALLHFTASGSEEVHEYQIGLIKVLLGLAPETPLPVTDGRLSGADKQEAEALLISVVRHWSALKNTSVAALRSEFLMRTGLLRDEDDGWRLQLERKPIDMLLDRLPWGISVVKLPWMKRLLNVEW